MNWQLSPHGTNVSCLAQQPPQMLLTFTTPRRAARSDQTGSATTPCSRVEQKMRIDLAGQRIPGSPNSNCCATLQFSRCAVVPKSSAAPHDISVASSAQQEPPVPTGWMQTTQVAWSPATPATPRDPAQTYASQQAAAIPTTFLAFPPSRTMSRGIFKNVNGPKSHKSSLLGSPGASTRPQSAVAPAVMVPAFIGQPRRNCDDRAANRSHPRALPSNPSKRAFHDIPNRYGNPTAASTTPRISGGVINSINFNFLVRLAPFGDHRQ